MKKLDVVFEDITHDRIKADAKDYGCTKSDVARAAMALGLRTLKDGANVTGLPVAHWIAALNGKVK